MSNSGTELETRARYLAMAQGTNQQVAAGLLVEFGLSMTQAQEFVAGMSEELQVLRWAGQMFAKERTFRLMSGEDLGKLMGAHLAAMEQFGRAYLGLGEREQVAKAIEAAMKQVARDNGGPKLKAVGS